ncbi:restriction endonuclease subunit S [Clostridium sp. YIM B02500]|uniref:restriction endonuclease subunit S n=1 Tax=Clostridium sp. YIM B02500 TaxID=2910681 RepID=UPI001EEE76C4|nr:restriction endonuclease subunit S [Clostridium sp. YIM B02500]
MSYSEWKICKFDDICLQITDGSHLSPKSVELGMPMASVKDMKEYNFDINNCRKISKEDYLKLVKNNCKPNINDVLLAKDGNTYLDSSFVMTKEEDIVILSSIAILRPNINMVLPEYLNYFLKDKRNKQYIKDNFGSGSAIPRIVLRDIKKIPILLPTLYEQNDIVNKLIAIDNKIKLNNEMNKTLEEMAQAIFKSWFVDFVPFKDGEFEESELGMIPKGWKISLLKDISKITMGQSPSSETYNECMEGLAFYQGVKDFTDRFPLVSTYCREPKKVAMPGEILLSVRAPVGRINISMEKCCIGRGCAALSSEKHGNGFLYYLLKNIRWDKYESGTVFTSIKKSDIENYKVILPNVEVIKKFNKIINSLDNRILNNSVQTRDLEETRDILLPKLISGEIQI